MGLSVLNTQRALLLIALAVTIAVYWSGLHGGYLFDDYNNIVENEQLQVQTLNFLDWYKAATSSPASDLKRPLSMLTFAANIYTTGLQAFPIKLTNLAIHLTNGLLLFAMLRALLALWAAQSIANAQRREQVQWLVTSITAAWLLLPINLTAVLYSVQRMETLANIFVLGGLWMYVDARKRSLDYRPYRWRMIVALVAATCVGVLAKETAVLLPLYAFMIELVIFRFRDRNHIVNYFIVLLFTATLALPLLVGSIWVLPKLLSTTAFAGRTFTLMERLLTEPRVLVDYIHWTLLPNLEDLSFTHDDIMLSKGLINPVTTILSILTLLALVVVAVVIRRHQPLVSLGIAWFFAAHTLTATILPLELVFEHRNYFASAGLLLALFTSILVPQPERLRFVRIGVLSALMLLYTGTTALRAGEWSNPLMLDITEAAKHPKSPRAMYGLGRTYVELSNYEPESKFVALALSQFEKAAELPGASAEPDAAIQMLITRVHRSINEKSWQRLQQKLRTRPIGPEDISALYSMVNCTIKFGCKFPADMMNASFEAALSHEPPNTEILTIYANYLINESSDFLTAKQLMRRAIEIDPNSVQYRANLIRFLWNIGEHENAKAELARLQMIHISVVDKASVTDLNELIR